MITRASRWGETVSSPIRAREEARFWPASPSRARAHGPRILHDRGPLAHGVVDRLGNARGGGEAGAAEVEDRGLREVGCGQGSLQDPSVGDAGRGLHGVGIGPVPVRSFAYQERSLRGSHGGGGDIRDQRRHPEDATPQGYGVAHRGDVGLEPAPGPQVRRYLGRDQDRGHVPGAEELLGNLYVEAAKQIGHGPDGVAGAEPADDPVTCAVQAHHQPVPHQANGHVLVRDGQILDSDLLGPDGAGKKRPRQQGRASQPGPRTG